MPRRGKGSKQYTQAAEPSGDTYGEGVRNERAQQAVPLENRRRETTATLQEQPQRRGPSMEQAAEAAEAAPAPQGGLFAPTRRPSEPLTAGMRSGPGPGPEVTRRPNPDVAKMRDWLPTLELVASQLGSSPTTRNLVRRIRGMMPPDV